ncbi:hypothetical protein ACFLXL_02840 [Chloroflexota bacterium]
MAIIPHYENRIESAKDLIQELPSIVEAIPQGYIMQQRWFGSKTKEITSIRLKDYALLPSEYPVYIMALVELLFPDALSEIYYLPMAFKVIKSSAEERSISSENVMLEIRSSFGTFLLIDALKDNKFLMKQIHLIDNSAKIESMNGHFNCARTEVLANVIDRQFPYSADLLRHVSGEQSNTSCIYNDTLIMKNFRRLADGINPDLEVPLFLTTKTSFNNMPLVAGYIEYSGGNSFHATIASLQNFVPNKGDGWQYTLGHLYKLCDFALEYEARIGASHRLTFSAIEAAVQQFASAYLEDAHRLGAVTGELHNALATGSDLPDFAPELITASDVQKWIENILAYIDEVMRVLRDKVASYPAHIQEQLLRIISNERVYSSRIEELAVLVDQRAYKTRYHGDYHLGQVLKTTDDFIIIDFEGEPARALDLRRAKHCPLKDIAGMLRSFDYAVYTALMDVALNREDSFQILEAWGDIWKRLVCEVFIDGYLEVARRSSKSYVPGSADAIQKALMVFQVDKAIYELNYELNNRPTWAEIPLNYLLSLLK